jgi:hypothetical protein
MRIKTLTGLRATGIDKAPFKSKTSLMFFYEEEPDERVPHEKSAGCHPELSLEALDSNVFRS